MDSEIIVIENEKGIKESACCTYVCGRYLVGSLFYRDYQQEQLSESSVLPDEPI